MDILSLKMLKQKYRVTYNSEDRYGVFKVHTKIDIVEFQPNENGLHNLDLEENAKAGITLVNTIHKNYKGYTKKQVKGAIKAHKL